MTFSGPILHIAFNGGWYLLNDLATYWELAIWFLLPNDLQYTFTLALNMDENQICATGHPLA